MLDTAFILAAGLGTRMRPLTTHTAKPLLHYRGERLIERHLKSLASAGFERAIINVSWQGQQIRSILGDGQNYGIRVQYSCEDEHPLETASGVARASPLLGEQPFLLLNGDIWTDINLESLRQCPSRPFIVLVDNPPHHTSGDFALNGSGQVLNEGMEKLTYAGIGIYDASFVESSAGSGSKLGEALRVAARSEKLYGTQHRGEWYDIGTPEALRSFNPLRRL